MKKTIVLLPGDGIGPEVTRAATAVLRETAHEFHHQFDFAEFPIGCAATDAYGTPLFNVALDDCRSRRLCSVDKANVLASSQLWRRTVTAMSAAYPGIRLEHMYVDNAAMQLTLRPAQFDVMLTTNMFGDILSDAAAALAGSIGVIPSASFGSSAPLFEPIHGS